MLMDQIRRRVAEIAESWAHRQQHRPPNAVNASNLPLSRYDDPEPVDMVDQNRTYPEPVNQGAVMPAPDYIASSGQPLQPLRTAAEAAQAHYEEVMAAQHAHARQMTASDVTASLNRELIAQQQLKRLDVRLDPQVNRIAEMFFTALMQRIRFEFGHVNPDWLNLGAREKRLWLEATELVLDELAKTPVANKELTAIVNKRIIQG